MQNYQATLFQLIQRKLGPEVSLAKSLEDVLVQSSATIYKKMRGVIALSMEEAFRLIDHFGISMSELQVTNTGNPAVHFHHTAVRTQTGPVQFLTSLLQSLQKLNQLPALQIWYASNEIPVFYYMRAPELAAFKLYMWNKTNWNESAAQTTFSPDALFQAHPEIAGLCRKLAEDYFQYHTIELWPKHILEHTLSQINACYVAGEMNRELKHILLDQLAEIVDSIQQMATTGHRGNGVAFGLYLNDIAFTSITILIKNAGEPVKLFTVLDNPNQLVTDHPAILEKVDLWLDRIQKNAVLISVQGERFRNSLCTHLHNRIDLMR